MTGRSLTSIRQWRTLHIHFVETPVFTRLLSRYLDDDAYRELQLALILRPEQGPVIRGSGGLRKIRWAFGKSGKRGGVRVIYFWDPERATFYCLYAYRKSVQGNLTPPQVRALRAMIREEFK